MSLDDSSLQSMADSPSDHESETTPEELKIPEELLKGLPKEKQKAIERFVLQRTETFSGPIPSPRLIAEYERAMPGSGERIFRLTEREQEHDHDVTNKMVDADIKAQSTALTYAFRLAVLMIVSGSALIALGRDVAGFAVLGTAIVAVIGVILKRKSDKRKLMASSENSTDTNK